MASDQKVCEWDALPNPLFNYWTIGNVSEVMPGVVRPFTATFMRPVDYVATRRAAEYLGVLDLVPSFEPPMANFIQVFAGRLALNLAWANAIIATWQTGGPSGLMDQFITSTDGQDITAAAAADQERAARIWRRIRRIQGALPAAVVRDRERVRKWRREEQERDLSKLSERQLWRLACRLRDRGAMLYMRHLYVSGAAGDYTDRLNRLLDRALPGHDPGLVIALTSALRGVETAAPAKGSWDVGRVIAARPALADAFRSLLVEALARRIQSPADDDWRDLARAFAAFLDEHGFRGQRELDPAAADWSEEPAFAISFIRAYVDAPAEKNPYFLEERAAATREAIEAQVGPAIPRGLRREYRDWLTRAQKFTRLRESSKANWVRLSRLERPPLIELGRRLAARGAIAARDDLFWLLAEEVPEVIAGRLSPADLAARVKSRKVEAERLDDLELPEVFQLPVTPAPKQRPQAAKVLQGMPVSPGKATGRARVVRSAEAASTAELAPGEVLVAPYTDAPWTPLFVPAAAVVVETGGILSHAATVAREFGIPAVVAVKGATELIRDGQAVTVDGMTGAVTLE